MIRSISLVPKGFAGVCVLASMLGAGCSSTKTGVGSGSDGGNTCDPVALTRACPAGSSAEVEVRSCDAPGNSVVTKKGTVTGVCGEVEVCRVFCRLTTPCLCGVASLTADQVECMSCPASCGDALCQPGEDSRTCPEDCGAPCSAGDERCAGALLQRCDAGGAWRDAPCGDGAVCASKTTDATCEPCDPSAPTTWYVDRDGDGFGDPEGATLAGCTPPERFVDDATDCDDEDFFRNPAVGCGPSGDAGSDSAVEAACADGSDDQSYGADMVGCDGEVLQCNAETLCAPAWHLCSHGEYALRGGADVRATAPRWLRSCVREASSDQVTCPTEEGCDCQVGAGDGPQLPVAFACSTGEPLTSDVDGMGLVADTVSPRRTPGCPTAPCTYVSTYFHYALAWGATCCR